MALRKLIKKIGVVHFDPIRIAGGAKSLVGSESDADREFVLEQIQKSVTLHQTDSVILMLHSDCGAYGGLQAFDNDAAREAESHRQDLHRAVEFLQSRIPQLKVQGFFLDFEGVWEAVLSQPITKSA